MGRIILEAPVFSIEAAMSAAKAGVDRLELCADFAEGGTTPSLGTFKTLKKYIDIPIFVMIRPRGVDFVYTDLEIEGMVKDIHLFKMAEADGFVFGAQTFSGKVDRQNCQKLIQAAGNLPCTFHRAFDNCESLEEALEDIVDLGFERILTSGGYNTVTEGLENLIHLIKKADDRIIIMPGGGSKPEHIGQLEKYVKLREIHASCKKLTSKSGAYQNPNLHLSDRADYNKHLDVDPDLVSEFRRNIQK